MAGSPSKTEVGVTIGLWSVGVVQGRLPIMTRAELVGVAVRGVVSGCGRETIMCYDCVELSSLLSGRMDKVLEDYDAARCQELYADDTSCAASTRSDAVSRARLLL